MKRTRAASKVTSVGNQNSRNKSNTSTETLPVIKDANTAKIFQTNKQDMTDRTSNNISAQHIDEDSIINEKKQKNKLNLKCLTERMKETNKNTDPIKVIGKNKIRAVVDLEMMKEELKQLEDPPLTDWEKRLSSTRLQYSFYDTPCEQLAQNLLGKILVRCLENGTVLKGRIVETEGYLGIIDKASHTYQNKVTPRNIPMYMPPGTIYVYMTYGMYHCFNISSQDSGACVLIRAVEPLLGLEYMELLRNMQFKENQKEKELKNNVRQYESFELCNDPSKICSCFFIEADEFNEKNIYDNNSLWIESDPRIKSTTIVAAPHTNAELSFNSQPTKLIRFYILGNPCVSERSIQYEEKISGEGCAVLIRALEPIEGMNDMTDHRNLKTKAKATKREAKDFKVHELCNGPSKLCMAYQLHKSHSKYSLCSWKGLWIEDDVENIKIKIVRTKRIGIDSYGAEWANKPLRYYVYGNKSVSKKDKQAEALLETDE